VKRPRAKRRDQGEEAPLHLPSLHPSFFFRRRLRGGGGAESLAVDEHAGAVALRAGRGRGDVERGGRGRVVVVVVLSSVSAFSSDLRLRDPCGCRCVD